jgi:mRNA interferase RelE/StbE
MLVLYSKSSLNYLASLDFKTKNRIVKGIDRLPYKGDMKRMKGKKINNIFRLRVGKYRIIYQSEKEQVKIIDIDTRGDIYK